MRASMLWAKFSWADDEVLVKDKRSWTTPAAIPKRVGSGTLEAMKSQLGATLIRSSYNFQPEYADKVNCISKKIEIAFSEPTFIVNATIAGKFTVTNSDTKQDLFVGEKQNHFRLSNHLEYSTAVVRSAHAEDAAFGIGLSGLANYLGEANTRSLVAALGLDGVETENAPVVPRQFSYILHQAFSPALRGEMRELFAQAKVLEYLSLLTDHVSDKVEAALSPNARKIVQLREELDYLNGEIVHLDELAKRYGISARALNKGFKDRYGQTIGAFIVEQRLSHAHAALEFTDVPMKVLSARLGYSHVTHFIAAFTRKFGYSPGTLRR